MSLFVGRSARGVAIAVVLAAAQGCGKGECDCVGPQDDTIFIHNGAVTIAGTLDVPSTPGPYPVMVFVPGSGTTTREDDKPAADIGLGYGIAVFRYDKRGLGQSTGTFEEVSTANSERVLADRASDVSAIVDYLRTDARVIHDKIFLWGTSQGAWVAPLVAAHNSGVAFVINVVGGGSPVGTVIEYGRAGQDASLSIDQMTQRASAFTGPYGYDPLAVVASLNIPVLWIYGTEDRFTPTQLDVPRVSQLSKPNFAIKVFSNMNHDLRDATSGRYPSNLFPDVFAWGAPLLGL